MVHYAPVSETEQPPSQKIRHHIVAKGETLYSIAWRYNLDYKKLARANGVYPHYRIYPGQRLELATSPKLKAVEQEPLAIVPEAKKLTTPKKPSIAVNKKAPRSIKATPPAVKSPPTKTLVKPKAWLWPAEGKMLARYQSNNGLNKGIDIKGELGEPVVAAAEGVVVYAGQGLRGYGKLLIVKHSEKYLSAYAHNRRLIPKEGERVKQGQKIAEMGSSGTDSVKLHFEIRYDGKPVNPLSYLPKKD